MNTIYEGLSKVPFLSRSFTLKIVFICFLGTYVPLIFILMAVPLDTLVSSKTNIIVIVFTAIAATTTLTMIVIKNLLGPIPLARKSLEDYQRSHVLPTLPVACKDEVGALMKKIQSFVTELDMHITNKNDMAALLSHDMRTPFVQLSSYAALIECETTNEYVQLICKNMMVIAEHQLNFLENVLKLLVIDDLEDHTDYSPVNIYDIIEEASLALATQISSKNIIIKRDFEADLKLMVNRYSMIHLFQNLLSNAVKFSYPDTEIVIRTLRAERDFIIEVSDHGAGFDADEADKLFTRFSKGKKGTMGERSTGIGLYLVKKIAEQNNGRITAKSEGKDKGATFTISFPIGLVVYDDEEIEDQVLASAD